MRCAFNSPAWTILRAVRSQTHSRLASCGIEKACWCKKCPLLQSGIQTIAGKDGGNSIAGMVGRCSHYSLNGGRRRVRLLENPLDAFGHSGLASQFPTLPAVGVLVVHTGCFVDPRERNDALHNWVPAPLCRD